MVIPGYSSLAEFARKHNLYSSVVHRQLQQGKCKWPRTSVGITSNSAYKCWENMIQRCTNPKASRYNKYGGRGITICADWLISFERFINYIGPRPSIKHSIDRIDVNGNYEPGNVKWSTYLEQANNKNDYKLNKRSMCIEKHRRKFRFTFNKVRYVFDTYEEAITAKEQLINGSGW